MGHDPPTHEHTPPLAPHHKLGAYQVALELISIVRRAEVRDPKLRDQRRQGSMSQIEESPSPGDPGVLAVFSVGEPAGY